GGGGKLDDRPAFSRVDDTVGDTVDSIGPGIDGAAEYVNAIALDAAGNVYLTGAFLGTASFNPFAHDMNVRSGGFYDAFIEKLAPDGTLTWVRTISGPLDNVGRDIAVDSPGHVHATGHLTRNAHLDPKR